MPKSHKKQGFDALTEEIHQRIKKEKAAKGKQFEPGELFSSGLHKKKEEKKRDDGFSKLTDEIAARIKSGQSPADFFKRPSPKAKNEEFTRVAIRGGKSKDKR